MIHYAIFIAGFLYGILSVGVYRQTVEAEGGEFRLRHYIFAFLFSWIWTLIIVPIWIIWKIFQYIGKYW